MQPDSFSRSSTPPSSSQGLPGDLLYRNEEIVAAVDRLAQAIGAAHAGRELTLVVVLDGALVFAADLLRRLPLRIRLETVRASSYRGVRRSGGDLALESVPAIGGRHVLLVDDILDSGRTLARIQQSLLALRPASLDICVLLDKPARRQASITARWIGLTVPDRFVVGYGLDHDGRFRNLPCIVALPPSSDPGR